MLKNKTSQKGFTIVELLIVIVVIGILAALVLNTFAGAQARARDTERKTDIDAVAKQLEVYHADHGAYPALSEWNSAAKAKATFGSIDESALTAPQKPAGTISWQGTASGGKEQYGFVGTTCVAAVETTTPRTPATCEGFTITYTQESDGTVVTKKSLSD